MNNTPSNPGASGADRHSFNTGAKTRRLLPLTVWLCSDSKPDSGDENRRIGTRRRATVDGAAGRAAAARTCPQHQQAVGRELAAHLIDTCTAEGDTVAEAFTTSETTLATAARRGRRALACVPHFPLAQHIGPQLRTELTELQLRRVAMRPCRPDQMHRGMADQAGQVSLVIAAPPSYEVSGRVPKGPGTRDCPACRADLWMLNGQQLGAFLTASWRVLRPGGHLAVITTARHDGARLIDPAPRIVRQASQVGFRYSQHVIALRVPVKGEALLVQSGPTDLAELRDVRSRALPPVVSVHADVCLFTRPGAPATGSDEPKEGRR
ncbi:hypothetical protein [Actinomadura sp. 9N407]|uniref:hypothetical protein n=1 Tax=Actinomadura sp. 9N407 TaxID=3375154 RepID=UPI0037B5BCF9